MFFPAPSPLFFFTNMARNEGGAPQNTVISLTLSLSLSLEAQLYGELLSSECVYFCYLPLPSLTHTPVLTYIFSSLIFPFCL